MKGETSGTYLLWEPRRHERHLEGVAVRVKRVEGIGVHGAEHGENTARKLLAYCNRRKATLGCAVLRNLLKLNVNYIQGESLARGPKLLSLYTVEQRGFLVHKYWQTGSFKACQTVFRTEFGERRAPSRCCIQKLVKKLQTRGSRSNACRLLSLGAY